MPAYAIRELANPSIAPHAACSPQEPFSRYHEVVNVARPDDNLTSG